MQSDTISEEWRDVPGFAGRYRVSSLGRVQGPTGKILRDRVTIWGYNRFAAYTGRSAKDYPVHQAVCGAWHGPRPTSQHCVNHKNGDRLDNRPENLEWSTPAENMAHKVEHGTDPTGERNPRARLTEADVARIRGLRENGHTYAAIALKFGVHKNTVRLAAIGDSWKCVADRRVS